VVAQGASPEPASKESEDAARTALKSLLDRGARLNNKELFDKPEKAQQAAVASAIGATIERGDASAAAAEIAAKQALLGQLAERPAPAAEMPAAAPPTAEDVAVSRQEPPRPEPQLDRVFREIIEGRPAVAQPSPAAPAQGQAGTDTAVAEKPAADTAERSEAAVNGEIPDSKTKTLLDRLRHIQERQTG
jgi:hypothetical protein